MQEVPRRYTALDLTIGGFLPERLLHITAIGVDRYAVRVLYEVEPPLPAPWTVGWTWLIAGRDDQGNNYSSAGGAHGLSDDGVMTVGTESLQPPPAPDATWLDIEFVRVSEAEATEHVGTVIRVRFPLEIASVGSSNASDGAE